MPFKDLMATFREKTEGLGDIAKDKVNEWLEEYKKAIVLLDTFGFKVGKFNFSMGIVPEINTAISGSIENVREDGIKKMIEEHQAEKLLTSLLNALIMAKRIREHIELPLTGVTLDVTLGAPPKITISLH
jgi:hypothetical protein